MKKTSSGWILGSEYTIIDPTGWDLNNFHYSFYEEKITKDEYLNRLAGSTLTTKKLIE